MTVLSPLAHRPDRLRAVSRTLALVATLWFALVCWAAASGVLAQLWQPFIAGLVAVGILLPTLWYFASPLARIWADHVGLRAITALHIWRIPAALAFFWYGLNGQLPTLFWILAGVGDLIAGAWALAVTARPGSSLAAYARMHRFGFADFVVAVGTGLTFTLLLDPRMAPIAALPLALIPLFGVGISGATHLMAFDMLRRANARGPSA
ncbi:MAG: permease [Rhodobacterales bacterium]|nr:MAG: permease [Rhodobacterales bacterium]